MSVFNKRLKKGEHKNLKYLGAKIQGEVFACLNLISTAKRIPRTTLVQDIFAEWYRNNWVASGTRDAILSEIADLAYSDWVQRNSGHKVHGENFNNFINEVREDLTKLELSDEIINEIVNLIHEKKPKTK